MTPIEASLECLLFVSGEPVGVKELAHALMAEEATVELGLRSLQVTLHERGSGLQLIRIAEGWQLSTRPEHHESIARFVARGSNKLSRAALETLAIIAYKQPVTVPEIEAVRGVSCAGVLKTLTERQLVRELGKRQTPGRPMEYATSPEFLHYFGIVDLHQLPELDIDEPEPVHEEAAIDGLKDEIAHPSAIA